MGVFAIDIKLMENTDIYDHIEINTYPQVFPSKEEAQEEVYDIMFGLMTANKWDEIIWKVHPEFKYDAEGWSGYALIRAKRAIKHV